MKLSTEASSNLRQILTRNLGEAARNFSDEDIENLGIRLLKLTATIIKNKTGIEAPDQHLS